MDLRAQLFAEAANRQLGRITIAEIHGAIAKGIIDAILSSGDGHTPQTAYQVLAIREEYLLLDQLGLKPTGQALIKKNGHAYDRISAVRLSGDAPQDVFFNIDLLLAQEERFARVT